MVVDVLLLGFTDCSIRVGDVGIQAVSGVLFFIDSEIQRTLFLFLFYALACRHPLLLSHPTTCVDMAGWSFLLFGSTVAICVVA